MVSARAVSSCRLAADGGLDTGLGQPLGIADRNMLRSAIRMVDQAGVPLRLTSVKRLLQCIENEFGAHGPADTPADDPAGKDVIDEGNINEPRPKSVLMIRAEIKFLAFNTAAQDKLMKLPASLFRQPPEKAAFLFQESNQGF